MGMTGAGMRKFMGLADQTMQDLFPARVSIGGVPYTCIGVGGAALSTYLDGGAASQGARYFRISKTFLGAVNLVSGMAVDWLDAPAGQENAFRIVDAPQRPHEPSQMIHCEPRKS